MRLCGFNFWRVFVAVLAATFVWLLAPKSALAAAPQCDARGAITFAPNVVLEEPNASVDVGQDDCSGGTTFDLVLEHGRGTTAQTSAEDGARALVATSPVILPAAPADVLEETAKTFVPPSGVRSRVDRPPRV